MSDTPETDAQIVTHDKFNGVDPWKGARFIKVVSANFARRLERERNEARIGAVVEELDNEYLRGRLDEWRECAEKLAKALRAEWKLRPLIRYGDALEALAEFDRLEDGGK